MRSRWILSWKPIDESQEKTEGSQPQNTIQRRDWLCWDLKTRRSKISPETAQP